MKKKKTIRNILIAVAVVIVIVAVIVLAVMLRKDGHGLNAFERAATAASADGEKVSMIEYALTLDTLLSNSSATDLTGDKLVQYQESAAKQALMIKIVAREAKALGLTLTDEEVQKSKESAQAQIDAVVKNYTESMIAGGSYSKAALDKQLANYYAQIGMNQSRYYAFMRERMEAGYYQTKLDEYYHANGSGLDENELLAYYHDYVKESMENYSAGSYSLYTQFFAMGYTAPLLYVPEGFIYVDFVRVSMDTEDEINAIVEKVKSGEQTFEDLMASPDNQDTYKTVLKGPYAIGEEDCTYLVSEAEGSKEFFEKASALEIGGIDSLIVPVKGTAEEGEEAPITGYTGYIFRRAEGTMCEEGDSGVIKIDWYDDVRESMEEGLREQKWLGDFKAEDVLYTYKGIEA